MALELTSADGTRLHASLLGVAIDEEVLSRQTVQRRVFEA